MAEQRTDAGVSLPQVDDLQSRQLMAKMARLLRRIGSTVDGERFRRRRQLPLEARRLGRKTFELYDHYLTYTVGRLRKKGWKPHCCRGCAACCFAMPAGLSSWELLLLYDHLLQTGQLARFFRRSLENCEVLSRARQYCAAEPHSGRREDEDRVDTVLRTYGRQQQPCAFLTDSRECQIYPLRPFACRMHFSFTPAEWCDPAHPRFSQAVRLNFALHNEVQDELTRLDGVLDLGLSDLMAPGLVSLTVNVMRFSQVSWTV
jgi:Fe-S-cluster containining protein